MTARTTARLAWLLCAGTLGLLGFAFTLAVLGLGTSPPTGYSSWNGQMVGAVGAVGAPVLGALIASRRPENPYGWLWCGIGVALALLSLGETYAAYDATYPGVLPAPLSAVILGGIGWIGWITITPFLLLLFPDGRLPGPRWRWVSRAAMFSGVGVLLGAFFMPGEVGIAPIENPSGLEGAPGLVAEMATGAFVFVLLGAIIASAGSLVVRFRRVGGIERQQIKWLALAAAVSGVELVFSGFLGQNLPGAWQVVLETATLAAIYLAIGFAIFRYRLYDIDRIISRTLAYGLLTAALASGYLLAVLTLQSLLPVSDDSPVIVAISTLGVVAAFGPLRARVRGVMDRRFNRRRYDAGHTIEDFGARLRNETDLDTLVADLVTVTHRTMQPAAVSLWLREQELSSG